MHSLRMGRISNSPCTGTPTFSGRNPGNGCDIKFYKSMGCKVGNLLIRPGFGLLKVTDFSGKRLALRSQNQKKRSTLGSAATGTDPPPTAPPIPSIRQLDCLAVLDTWTFRKQCENGSSGNVRRHEFLATGGETRNQVG
jgi:hypothetical protein